MFKNKLDFKRVTFTALKILAIFMLFTHFGPAVTAFDIGDIIELVAMLSTAGFIVYNEIRSHRQFSIIDLISIKDALAELSANQQVMMNEMQHKASHSDFSDYRTEQQQSYFEVQVCYKEIADALNAKLSFEPEYEEEEVEDEPKKSKRKKTSKRK